ncbi:MAG: gliding motility protein GldB-related protein [Mucilaginibacter sp.]
MIKINYLLLTFLLINGAALAQSKLTKKADSLYKAKNYANAGGLYLLSARQDEFKTLKQNDYYNAACCYALVGKPDSAMSMLKLSIQNGYRDTAHVKEDKDLIALHSLKEWPQVINTIKSKAATTNDPYKAQLVTTDVKNFWKAYDLAQKDTADRYNIYKKYYVDPGTDGLQDYFSFKVRRLKNFVAAHDKTPKFYAAIRENTLSVDKQKPQMLENFVKLKSLYPNAVFPNIYFVIGCFTSAGTTSDNGLLIGVDQAARTPEIPTDELNLWQRNNFSDIKHLPNLIAHELVHFNQNGIADDTTLLHAVLIEGMADFIGEKISGRNANERLHIWAKGKERKVWADFEKEMYLDRGYNWIGNSSQETADKPADLGYWVGYQICKAYYDNSLDKNKAISDMLNIKNCKEFYEKSGVAKLFSN